MKVHKSARKCAKVPNAPFPISYLCNVIETQ